jgi:hypothetical protein
MRMLILSFFFGISFSIGGHCANLSPGWLNILGEGAIVQQAGKSYKIVNGELVPLEQTKLPTKRIKMDINGQIFEFEYGDDFFQTIAVPEGYFIAYEKMTYTDGRTMVKNTTHCTSYKVIGSKVDLDTMFLLSPRGERYNLSEIFVSESKVP